MASTKNNNTKMTKEEQLYLAAIINANRHQKLHELAHLIKGTPAGTPPPRTKGASASNIVNTKKALAPVQVEGVGKTC
jgi:hypothetical protein